MMNRQTSIAYIDLLTVLVALFAVVTGVLLSQNRELSKGNVTEKAEFLAVLEWDEGSKSDVDLWVRNPGGDVVNFRSRDRGLVSLDRDDMGSANNTVVGADGTEISNQVRREMAVVRAIMPGQHLINVMLFSLRDKPPVSARVQIIKLNPYRVLLEREVVLTHTGEEQTVASFDVASDGTVDDVDTSAQIKLAEVVQ
jgi:hypothetical protein